MTLLLFVCFKNMLGHQVHERILLLEKESIKYEGPNKFSVSI